jgi:hypothetical protein
VLWQDNIGRGPKMLMGIVTKRWVGFFIGLVFITTSASCAGRFLSWQGAGVKEKLRVSLTHGGPHLGAWETRDVRIDYEYLNQDNRLTISGHVMLNDYLTTGFTVLDYLRIHLFFLDNDGKVVEAAALKNIAYRRWMITNRMQFRHLAQLPEGAVSFAFGYTGRVRDGGRDRDSDGIGGGTDWEFWEVPGSDFNTPSNTD